MEKIDKKEVENIPFTQLMLSLGGVQVKDSSYQYWKIPDVGIFYSIENQWEQVSPPNPEQNTSSLHGFGVINFLTYVMKKRYPEALEFLMSIKDKQFASAEPQLIEDLDFNLSKSSLSFQALKLQASQVSVKSVIQQLGGIPYQDKDPNKWKIHDIGNITVTGQKWYNQNESYGKTGPISLVRYVLKLSFNEAVQWIVEQFGIEVSDQDIQEISYEDNREKKSFDPPTPHPKNLSFVRQYLHYTRGIPLDLINDLIAQKTIYADEHRNCVFSADGIAELRSTFDGEEAVKKLVPGSTRLKGILIPRSKEHNENVLAMCEGSIDAISYRAIYPGRSAISCAGAGFEFARTIAIDCYERGITTVAAFDNDDAGLKASQNIFNYFFIRTWIEEQYLKKHGEPIDLEKLHELFENKTIQVTWAINSDILNRENSLETLHLYENADILFFNHPEKTYHVDSKKYPVVIFSIDENDLGIPTCSHIPMIVPKTAFQFICDEFSIKRELPPLGKDWNDYLKVVNNTTLNKEMDNNSISTFSFTDQPFKVKL